jgi:hypothetical protein
MVLVTILAVTRAMEVTMTGSTKAAMAASVAGAFVLGIWIAPHVRDITPTTTVEKVATTVPVAERDAPAVRTRYAKAEYTDSDVRVVRLEASAPPVQKHVKSLLTWGTDTEKAAEGFTSAEQFLTVAHVAKNTEVPFMLLKHRVLNENQSLEAAIRASQPELDASLEAERARLEARANLSRMMTGMVE